MNALRNTRYLQIVGLLLGVVIWMANNGNAPDGNTGAPFNGNCNSCHSGGAFNGTVDISGVPSTIDPNTTYPIVLTVTPTAGSAIKAGFQLVVVDGANANCGNLTSVNGETGTSFLSSREYVDQRGGKAFGANPDVSWTFNWTSPASVSGSTVKFYFIANLTNNNNNSSGDFVLTPVLQTFAFAGLPPVTATIASSSNVSCFGGNNGSATAEPGGGAPPYTYAWTGGQTGQTASNLTAGTYTVTVTGASGSGTATATVTITQPTALTLTATPSGTINCIQTTATATANISGGTPGYTFEWSNGASGNPATFMAPGAYTVTGTDANGCTKTASFTILGNTTQPNAVAGPPVSITCTQPTTTLNGTGSSSGPNYSYLWTTSDGHIVSGATSLMPVVNAAGTYQIMVTNSTNGCTNTATTTVTAPTPPTLSTTGGQVTCNNPSVTLTTTTNASSPTFSWTGPGGFTSAQQSPTVSVGGTYNVTVTSGTNGCSNTATATVTQNNTPPTASTTGGQITCAITSVTLTTTTNAVAPTFSWTGPGGFTSSQQSPTVSVAGTYTVTITNPSNGCTNSATATVTQNNTAPTLNTAGGQITCTNTSIPLTTTTNATTPTFSWAGPGGFTSTQQSPSVSAAGTYTVTVTNTANSCTASTTATVTLNNTAPTASTTGGQITCTTPSIPLTTTTNASPATFSWTGPNAFSSTQQSPSVSVAGTYTVTITNTGNGCSATATATVTQNNTVPSATAAATPITCLASTSNLSVTTNAAQPAFAWTGPSGFTSTSQNPSAMAAGTYTVTVTNGSNGCTTTSSVSVVQNTTLPTASAAMPASLNCTTTSIQLDATASSQGGNFSYLWSTANGHIVTGANTLTPTVDAAGNYNLVVTNSTNGCTASTSVTVAQIPPVTAAIGASTNVSCNGAADGSATVSPGGGSGTYTYTWSNGANTASINNLLAGTYVATVSDGSNCTSTASVTISQPNVLAANVTATGETSANANNGTATAAPTGGTTPYGYLWSTGGTTASISNLAPGNYTVTITDGHGCTAVQTVTVNSFNCALSASSTTTNVTCNGANNGTATVNLVGAAMPVTYLWSNGASTATVSNLAPGNYTVQITDANNCPASLNISISEPPVLAANATATGETSLGAHDGTATVQPTGGTAGYAFLWSNGETTAAIDSLAPGLYIVTVTDANACTVVQSVGVNAFNCAITANISAVNVTCFGGNNGQATVTLTGGTLPLVYAWSTGGNTATISNLAANTYSVTVTDASGCIVNQTVTITEPAVLTLAVSNTNNVICPEDATGSATVTPTGGTAPYTIAWPNGGNGTNLGVGSYTVTVTDENTCTSTASFSIISNDTEAPTLSCPQNVFRCGADIVDYPSPIATDNCSLANAQPIMLISGQPSGSPFDEGVTTQVFQVTDGSGNTAQCSFTVTVYAVPDIIVDEIVDDQDNAGVGGIKVTPTGGAGPYSFSWFKEGSFFSDHEDISGLNAGNYGLTITDANGCTTILAPIKIDNVVATSEPGVSSSVRLWPNPARTAFRMEARNLEMLSGEILDVRGQVQQQFTATELTSPVDVSNLPSGLYFLKIQIEHKAPVMVRWIKTE